MIFTTAGATRALTFGKGIHYCLGAALAKLEAQVALRRFSRLRLVEGKKLSFQPTITLCGPAKLWAEAVSAA